MLLAYISYHHKLHATSPVLTRLYYGNVLVVASRFINEKEN